MTNFFFPFPCYLGENNEKGFLMYCLYSFSSVSGLWLMLTKLAKNPTRKESGNK